VVVLRDLADERKKHFRISALDVLLRLLGRCGCACRGSARRGTQEGRAQRAYMREDRSANIVVAVKAGEGDIPTAEAKEG
jgi:hypothetical protein